MAKLTASQEALENFIQAEENAPVRTRRPKVSTSGAEQSARNISAMSGEAANAANSATTPTVSTPVAQRAAAAQDGAETLVSIGRQAQEQGEKVTNWASGLSTPGGIIAMVVILLLIVWILVPVNNGMTRLQLLYMTLIGRTSLEGSFANRTVANTSSMPSVDTLAFTVPQGSTPVQTTTSPPADYNSPGAVQSLSNVNGTGYIPDFGATF